MKYLIAILLTAALALSVAAAEDADSSAIKPKLGSKFGTIIEIEGKIVDDTDTRLRAHLGKKLIEINRIDDKKLDKPVVMEILTFSFATVEIPARGVVVRFRGYETGGFTGIPNQAFEDIPRVATTTHHFESWFQVTKRL